MNKLEVLKSLRSENDKLFRFYRDHYGVFLIGCFFTGYGIGNFLLDIEKLVKLKLQKNK